MKFIDPHIHLFDLTQGKYAWLKPENAPYWPDKKLIHRDFSECDLVTSSKVSLDGFVHIEAGFDNEQPQREIEWLERQVTSPFRSIAAVDITLPFNLFSAQLARLKQYDSVVGVRHILDDNVIPILSTPNVHDNLRALSELDWIFELQFNIDDAAALEHVITTFSAVPELRVTLNHLGFSGALKNAKQHDNFRNSLSRLVTIKNLAIKCSGWEMVDRNYSFKEVATLIELVIEQVGEQKVMLASNFPLCLFSTPYDIFWESLAALIGKNKKALFYDNAFNWYRF